MDTATVEGAATGSTRTELAARLQALRAELARRDLDGFIVPRADEHQGEWVPARAERLAWLTGFTGSAGLAVVLRDTAAIFTDGRYTLQVRDQVDVVRYQLLHISREPPTDWIAENLTKGARLGYDPWLHTEDGARKLEEACRKAGARLEPCPTNPLDAVWPDQPGPPLAPVAAHDLRYAGKPSTEKRREIVATLAGKGARAAVLTLPESIAWLLNVRGGDVAHSPLPLSFAILRDGGAVDWFVDRRKVGAELRSLLGDEVTVLAPSKFGPALDRLAREGTAVLVDPATAAAWIFNRLAGHKGQILRESDPCLLPKACKNETELAGAREAHRRDGAALSRFLAWLAREAPGGRITELAAAERLETFRRKSEAYREPSFDTISGAGPNGAIVHYRATAATDRQLEPGTLYLVDSGAQYLDGTTDVTRTVAIGTPPADACDRFTRVLKGHIAMATARFPNDTTGSQLDALARRPLWEAGLDYDHGTGHGVGSYLGVHEGPQRISKVPNRVALRPGMIISNEPGYYKAGAYGIRIENLVAVVAWTSGKGAEQEMLAFETLTLAPIDRALIEPRLMSADEIAWLDAYHARVSAELTPLVDAETAAWLATATAPLEG